MYVCMYVWSSHVESTSVTNIRRKAAAVCLLVCSNNALKCFFSSRRKEEFQIAEPRVSWKASLCTNILPFFRVYRIGLCHCAARMSGEDFRNIPGFRVIGMFFLSLHRAITNTGSTCGVRQGGGDASMRGGGGDKCKISAIEILVPNITRPGVSYRHDTCMAC